MRVAIVGSRTFPQLRLVAWFLRDLPAGVVVVSGGAKGVDAAAAEGARARGLEVVEHLPNLDGCTTRAEFAERYYARNQKVVDDSDLVVAFTEKDYGGTWDTIKRARRAGKPVKIIKPALLFPGDHEPATDPGDEEPNQEANTKGKGPFAIKRVSLGSYALRRKCYIGAEEWADIIDQKDNNPERLAREKIIPAMVAFFEGNRRFGTIHAVTVPPRSRRNLEKPHVMDITAQAVAEAIGCEWVRMFAPWEKSTRGRHAEKGVAEVLPSVRDYVGRVVWVLDDVTTTNHTLRSAVQGLTALEIHAHGLAWVLMA